MKKFILPVILSILCIIFLSLSIIYKIRYHNIQVYSLLGENDSFKISNVTVFSKADEEIFDGGYITYIGKPIDNISSYSIRFYTNINFSNETLLCKSCSFSDDTPINLKDELEHNSKIGSIKSANVLPFNFSKEDVLNDIYCELETTTSDGKKITSTLKLNAIGID